MFIAAQFTTAKCWRQPNCPSVNEWIKKNVVHLHNGILHSRRKEGNPTLHDSMDGMESIMLSEISQAVKDKYHMILLQNRQGEGVYNILLPKGPPFLSGGPPHLLGSLCPLPEERCLSMPEIGEKERNYLFKSYTE